MALAEDALKRAEVFRAASDDYLAQVTDAAEEVHYETGQVLFDPGSESDAVHVVVSGMVALYVMYHNDTMLTFDILGPNGVTGTSGFFPRDAHPVRAMAIMPSNLLVVPARFLQGSLLLNPAASGPIYEELCHLMRRRIGNLIRVVTAEEATFPAEQPCPVHRDTRFLASANIRTGEIKGMCQRQFACTAAQGKGCPMSGKPAQQFHSLFAPPRLCRVEAPREPVGVSRGIRPSTGPTLPRLSTSSRSSRRREIPLIPL